MPTLSNKPHRSYSWLPNQVLYGIDCSDADPGKWKPFGELADVQAAEAAKRAQSAGAKVGQPAQSAPGAP